MQHLQWFPGHMTAAMRMMEENLRFCDGVIVILDARAPRASLNKKLNKLFANKKVLYVINKSDLVEENDSASQITVNNSTVVYEGEEYDIILQADFDNDLYKIIVT